MPSYSAFSFRHVNWDTEAKAFLVRLVPSAVTPPKKFTNERIKKRKADGNVDTVHVSKRKGGAPTVVILFWSSPTKLWLNHLNALLKIVAMAQSLLPLIPPFRKHLLELKTAFVQRKEKIKRFLNCPSKSTMGPTTNVGTSIKYLHTYRSPEAGAREMHLPRHPILVVSVYGHVSC